MPLTTPYEGLPPELHSEVVLLYISTVILSRSNFSFELPIPFDPTSESDYNNITWYDTYPQPTWADILSYYLAGWEWAITSDNIPYEDVPYLGYRIDYLDEYIEEQLEPNVNSREPAIAAGSSGQFLGYNKTMQAVTKANVGLGNVDNTSDVNKPVSTAQASAISTAIAGLVNSAPGTLDTLKELADALGDDANYATTITTALGNKVDKVTGKGLSTNDYTTAEQTKLAGLTSPKAYEGTTLRANAFPIFAHATVASGVAVFNLTSDGTSGGTALFSNGIIQDSINLFVSDATASYQMSFALTNSNKTLTVTTNKLTTANILSGILGQAAANGAVVKLQIWGY